MPWVAIGDCGAIVGEIRSLLVCQGLLSKECLSDESVTETSSGQTSVFDHDMDRAVRAFQQNRGLLVDGVVGPETYRFLRAASFRLGTRQLCYIPTAPLHGDDVASLQSQLQNLGFYCGLIDGYFGKQTHQSLIQYQQEFGLQPDGICGPIALRSLENLGSRITGGSAHAIYELETVREAGPRLTGKRIFIDPGLGYPVHGYPLDYPQEGIFFEADLLWDLAIRLNSRMKATGINTRLSRLQNTCPSDSQRATLANLFGADLVISLRCATYHNDKAHGVSSFYFGNTHGSFSTVGQTLAGYIQREIIARTALTNCFFHGKTWDLLRLTTMPTVQIDVGYITSPIDSAILAKSKHRNDVVEAILIAVKRLYLLGANDQPTGTYTFNEILATEQADFTAQ